MTNAVTTRNTPLSPTTFAEAERFAVMMAKSTMVPQDYRGKPENIMFAMQFGAELGLSPLQSLQSISNINGKWAVYGDALLAIVLASPLCEDVIERLDGEDDNLRAICEARRRGAAPKIQMFSVADAKKASLWGKQGPWTQYPRRMLQWRARGFALRDAFPDLLRGVITVEEARDIPESGMVDVTPPPSPEPLSVDLDAFAAEQIEAPPASTPDERIAEAAAGQGTVAFRDWWQQIDRERRDRLRPHLAHYQALASAADTEMAQHAIHEPGRAPPEPRDGPHATPRRRGRPPGPGLLDEEEPRPEQPDA